MLVWKHNSFIGQAVRMRRSADAISGSSTASPRAKHLASQIHKLALELEADLRKERIDS